MENFCPTFPVLHPLNELLQQGRKWEWPSACQKAFQTVKDSLLTSKVLMHYDPAQPIKLAADASAYGVGAVISHTLPDGTERPVAFASRTLSPSERNYAQIEKEALALIFGIKKFHQYLYGRHFTLVTDHKPLLAILGPHKGIPSLAAARLQRWALILAAYNYRIEFKPTQQHSNADGLSRLPLPQSTQLEYSTDASHFNVCQLEALPVTAQVVMQATKKDATLSKVFRYTKDGWPAQVPTELKAYHSRRHELTVEAGCLLWGIRVIIPNPLRPTLLQELHRDHPGSSRMKSQARSHLWWPGLDKDLEDLAKACQACQEVKQAPPAAPMHPWTWPSKPWHRVHIDFAGPFLDRMYLLTVDAHSKWPEVFEMTQTTTAKTISALRHLFGSYGLPEQIVSDNGPQFTSSDFAEFLRANGIKHIRSSPYHPSSNGAIERFVRTFKVAMKAGSKDGLTPQHRLENFLLTYRSTPHATTGVAPSSLFLGRAIRTRFDLVKPSLEGRVLQKQASQKLHRDKHTRQRNFSIGHRVLARNFRPGPAWVPAVITEQLGPVTFAVTLQDGQCWKRHLDHLKDRGNRSFTEFQKPADSDFPELTPVPDDPPVEVPPPPVDEPRYPPRVHRPPDRFM